jgi:hypothetical protein
MSRDLTLATNTVQAKMEDLKRESFANLSAKAGLFNLTGYGFPYTNSSGRVYIQTNYGNYTGQLTYIRVVGCFQSRGRTVGDNATACTSSPIEAVTLRTQ